MDLIELELCQHHALYLSVVLMFELPYLSFLITDFTCSSFPLLENCCSYQMIREL